jgi:hypothetical protein
MPFVFTGMLARMRSSGIRGFPETGKSGRNKEKSPAYRRCLNPDLLPFFLGGSPTPGCRVKQKDPMPVRDLLTGHKPQRYAGRFPDSGDANSGGFSQHGPQADPPPAGVHLRMRETNVSCNEARSF